MQEQTPQMARSAVEATVGAGLFLTPWWAQFLLDVGAVASVVAQVTGAIIGVYGVYRLVKDGYTGTRR